MPRSNKEEQLHSTSDLTDRYKKTVEYLYTMLPMYQRVGAIAFKPDLSNTLKLCEALGNPQDKIKTVHIAGTNGKGSVAHIMAAVLQSAGYKTGLYTSPHYKDFTERIKIDGNHIPKQSVLEFTDIIQPLIPELKPSFFEITVAMAFYHFAQYQTDIAIIETGLGGRLDSTNIIQPELSVITNIDLEHTAILGDTIEKIAFEKAGIIKHNTPVVTGTMQNNALEVITNRATEMGAEYIHAPEICKIYHNSATGKINVSLNGNLILENLQPSLMGDFQLENIQTAVASLEILKTKAFEISEMHLRNGIENTRELTNMPGRWQQIGTHSRVFVDGAHNPHALKAIRKELDKLNYRQLHLVMGFVQDKDIGEMLKLLPADATYYFSKPDVPRGLDTTFIETVAKKRNLNFSLFTTVADALNAAHKNAQSDDVIVVCGSIFTVAEILP